MGNDVKKIGGKIGYMFQQHDKFQSYTPQGVALNKQQNITDIEMLNVLLAKNVINLGSKLQLQTNSLSKNGSKWQNSIIRGKITVQIEQKSQNNGNLQVSSYKQEIKMKQSQPIQPAESINIQKLYKNQQEKRVKQPQPKQQSMQSSNLTSHSQPLEHNHKQNSYYKKIRSYTIILTLSQFYEIKKLLQNYSMQQSQLSQKRKSSQGKICVICLDNKPEQVLPCAHSYCKNCIDTYVINKQKKCPMCRKSYRQSLSENIYQIIQWDQDFVIEMRTIFYKIIQKNNQKQVKKIKKLIGFVESPN